MTGGAPIQSSAATHRKSSRARVRLTPLHLRRQPLQPVPVPASAVTATTRPTGVADVDGVAGAGIGEWQPSSAGAARTNGPMNVRVFVLGRGLASFPYHEIRLSSKRYLGSHSLTPTKYHHVIPILYTLNDETSPLTTMPLVTRSLQQSTVNML